ncbi:MAG: hypothetical protein A2Y10_03910 [Planctomycetes bacterium GWF2_41_51]|nr:MAG: hypothetical protein A2Y10_03910 [Planctomycetes bacterium GWF2_41_51]HBG26014.1 hypothetical protein [Phycisphaerales bacterium]
MKTNIIFLIISALLMLIAPAYAERIINEWSYVYDGLWYATGSDTSPRLMNAYALRIDLANPNISLKSTNTNGDLPLDTTVRSTPTFLEGQSLEAAINTNFFTRTDGNADVLGVLRRNNVLVSAGEATYPIQLRINADKIASIVEGTGDASGIHTVAAGDVWNLVNGTASGDNNNIDARTGAGISKNERFLILLVVDGNEGATILDTANWLKDFGAWNGLNLAGGQSSCMVRSEFVDGPAVVLNNPLAGSPKKVGANLGVNTIERVTRQDIFIKGENGSINHKYCVDGNEWTSWEVIGAPSVGLASTAGPAAVSRMPGRIDVFCVGADRNLYTKSYINGIWSTSWTSLGNGDISGNPDVCSWDSNRIDVFCRNTSNQLMQKAWTEAGGWGVWVNRGGTLGSGPSAVSREPGHIDVFAANANDQLMQKTYSNGSWGEWVNHGDPIVGVPDACARTNKKMSVFWRANSTIMHKRWRGPLAGWDAAEDIGGSGCDHVGATSPDPDVITVFVPRSDGNIWSRQWRNRSGWMRWTCEPGYDKGTTGGGVDACSWTNDAGTHQ